MGAEAFEELSKNEDALHARIDQLPKDVRLIEAILVKRDAEALTNRIEPLIGKQGCEPRVRLCLSGASHASRTASI